MVVLNRVETYESNGRVLSNEECFQELQVFESVDSKRLESKEMKVRPSSEVV